MRIEGDTLIAKSSERWYELERSGIKPNTIRNCTYEEWWAINDSNPHFIRVQRGKDRGTCFTRRITLMTSVHGVFDLPPDRVMVLICWEP